MQYQGPSSRSDKLGRVVQLAFGCSRGILGGNDGEDTIFEQRPGVRGPDGNDCSMISWSIELVASSCPIKTVC